MKEFLKYYFNRPLKEGGGKMWFTLNHLWLFGSLLFIGLLIRSYVNNPAPIYLMIMIIPFLMIIYNFVDEYHTFKKSGKSFLTACIFYGLCGLDLLIIIIKAFITK